MDIPVDRSLGTRPDDPLIEFAPDLTPAARLRMAARDIVDAGRLWRLSWVLGWLDIRLRYRGSVLGPFWLTLSTGVMIASLGVLYSVLFKMELRDYLPFIALSIVLWNFLSQLVVDGCLAFTSNEQMIRSIRMPYTLYAGRSVVRNVLILAHNVIVIAAVDVLMGLSPGWGALASIPGLLLWTLDGFAVTLLLGGFCARFRDIPPIVGSIMQIAFYVTPVIWKPEQLGAGAAFLPFNPFFVLMETVRAPLLGHPAGTLVWISAILYSGVLCALSLMMFSRVRSRIAFWV